MEGRELQAGEGVLGDFVGLDESGADNLAGQDDLLDQTIGADEYLTDPSVSIGLQLVDLQGRHAQARTNYTEPSIQ